MEEATIEIDEVEINDESMASGEKLRSVHKVQCAGCGRYFVGTSIFDQHRVGPAHQRRCLTDDEMRRAGLATERRAVTILKEGIASAEPHDVWYVAKDREKIRQAYQNTQN